MDPQTVFLLESFAADDFGGDGAAMDFRIFIRADGSADLATGAPDYDTDHRGYCGAGSVSVGDTLDDCRQAVAAAFDDAIETFFCSR